MLYSERIFLRRLLVEQGRACGRRRRKKAELGARGSNEEVRNLRIWALLQLARVWRKRRVQSGPGVDTKPSGCSKRKWGSPWRLQLHDWVETASSENKQWETKAG
jgi:hypothetical protein